ncbi:MAG: KilA-N domain-containing protein [Saprospiraceae bacterium]
MEKEVKVFEYEGKRITFDFGDGNEMVNATEIAKAFGKRLPDFTRLKQTKRFINELETLINITVVADVQQRKKAIKVIQGGNRPDLQGTWYEQRLALKLAAWLNPKFELWIYGKIRELLSTGKTELESKPEVDIKTLEFVFQKIKDNAMEIHYLSDIIDDLKKINKEE